MIRGRNPLIYASFTERHTGDYPPSCLGKSMREDYNVFYAQYTKNVDDVLQKLYQKKGNSGELDDPSRLLINADDLLHIKKSLVYSTKISPSEVSHILQLVAAGLLRIHQGYDVWMTRMAR